MRTCPSCGYRNGEPVPKCHICGKDLSGLKPEAPPPNEARKNGFDYLFLGLLLLVAGLYFAPRGTGQAARPVLERSAAHTFSNDGVVLTLEKLSSLKFPGAEEKSAALAAFDNPDWKVRAAGARTAGSWLRAGVPGLVPLRSRLVSALNDNSGPVKKEAAMETGLLIGLGLIKPSDLPEPGKTVRAFIDDSDDLVKSAGYFLAAMTGQSDLKGRLEFAAAHEPVAMTRLYASCALAGLGSEEGAAAVCQAASDPDAKVRKEAVLCLSYSASPSAVPLLRKISASDADFEVADNARFSLNLRKQLAIINNKPG